ncbi:MAG: hypothetical protein EHM64_12460 [Ignavibacteriae bacterium]|nr:MAG: hypothetical protein EHM64_12460 [Ignavibacteriota bacterium]
MSIDTGNSNLEREILQTISYFDVFSYPLTRRQLHVFLARVATTDLQLEETLQRMLQNKLISSSRGYFYSSNRRDEIVAVRLENERRASRMLRQARWVSFFLKQIPFVRAVFVTGSLSKHVAERTSDIDFMIIAELNRLWICKMILTGFRRIFLFNSHKYFCINLMVTEKAMHFPRHNYFTAVEIATSIAVWNTPFFLKYQKENAWIHEYLPNWQPLMEEVAPLSNTRSPVQRIFESILGIIRLDAINTNYMLTAKEFWKRKYKDFDEHKFNSIIQCTPDISSVWSFDHQTRIVDGFHQRLDAYGLKEAL